MGVSCSIDGTSGGYGKGRSVKCSKSKPVPGRDGTSPPEKQKMIRDWMEELMLFT